MPYYSRDIPTGWLGFFPGGLECELRTDLPYPELFWFTARGSPLGAARWGRA